MAGMKRATKANARAEKEDEMGSEGNLESESEVPRDSAGQPLKKKAKVNSPQDSSDSATNATLDNGPNWKEPDYSDKAWFKKAILHCQVCKKDYASLNNVLQCLNEHKKDYLRCSICFTLALTGDTGTNNLFEHYLRRHKGNQPNRIECPYCKQSFTQEQVACHVISIHFRKAVGNPGASSATLSDAAAKFLREINPAHARKLLRGYELHVSNQWLFAEVVAPSSEDYKNIDKYIRNSQAHPEFEVKLVEVLKVVRKDDFNNWPPLESQDDNRVMLWHGTRSENIYSILTEGLKIPPRDLQMFGQGIYFADRVSKSAQYTEDLDLSVSNTSH